MSLTLLPVPVTRREHRPYLALAGLQVIDVLSTALLLNWYLGTTEANPVARLLTDHGTQGLLLLLAFKLLAVALVWSCQTGIRLIGAVYSAVVANNLIALALLAAG